MSSINSVGGAGNVYKPQAAKPASAPAKAEGSTPTRASDRLELSGMSGLLKTLKQSDVRTEKVAQVRAAIADGSYDKDDAKLDAAIDRMIDDL
jgi:negative regulator of flagellin synthesis FlgM